MRSDSDVGLRLPSGNSYQNSQETKFPVQMRLTADLLTAPRFAIGRCE